MASTSDLISGAVLTSVLDLLAAQYNRLKSIYGDGTEQYKTTLGSAIAAYNTMSVLLSAPPAPIVNWEAILPAQGVIWVGSEAITYRSVSVNTLTVQTRGAGGTPPVTHAIGLTVYLPASASRYALRCLEQITGDGTTGVLSVGAADWLVISDLGQALSDFAAASRYAGQFQADFRNVFTTLRGHIGKEQGALLLTPSFGALTVNDLIDYLRYLNDRTSGSAFGYLAPWQISHLYWFFTGQVPLDGKTVFPPQTVLATAIDTAGTVAWSTTAGINRYSTTDSVTWTPGYSAQRIRARCTVVAGAAATLTAVSGSFSGQQNNGEYYGRPLSNTVSCGTAPSSSTNIPQAGDTLTIDGYLLTFVAAITLSHNQVLIGATNDATAVNFRAIVNAEIGTTVLATAGSNANDTILTPFVSSDQTAHTVVSSNGTRLGVAAGTFTGRTSTTFGGGAGSLQSQGAAGTGSDSDWSGVAADDDPKNFSLPATVAVTGVANPAGGIPIIVTTASHNFVDGQTVTVAGVTGATAANGTWSVAVIDANHISLNESASDNNPYVNGGTVASAVDLSKVGSWAPLIPPNTLDRAHYIRQTSAALTKSGAGQNYQVVIESYPDRNIT